MITVVSECDKCHAVHRVDSVSEDARVVPRAWGMYFNVVPSQKATLLCDKCSAEWEKYIEKGRALFREHSLKWFDT